MADAVRALVPGVVIVGLAVVAGALLPPPTSLGSGIDASPRAPLQRVADPVDDPRLAEFVVATIMGEEAEAPAHRVLSRDAGPVYAALRSDGLRVAEAWGTGPTREAALRSALEAVRSLLPADARGSVDVVELSIGGRTDAVQEPDEDQRLANVHRGVLGLEVRSGDRVERFAPTQMIANNLTFEVALGRAATVVSPSIGTLKAIDVSVFTADQLLVDVSSRSLTWLFRGNTVVPPEAVSIASSEALATSLGDWLIRNVHPDGRMTYKYWPSRGEESTANNTIRQWMATIALGRVAAARDDEGLWTLARRNIEYNLANFYEQDGEFGLIVEADGDVKLGAVALAALALHEHPDRSDFAEQESALRRTVDALWQPDGSFRTFYRPVDRNDNQNFYPGEALLLWAEIVAEDPRPQLVDRFMRSFRYYRDWHREQRNPAFIPWHTQAYVTAWMQTRDDDLREFVFEMNDWLLDFQQWDTVEYPDLRGRFYDPLAPSFGPPHASSDGVYLEGLVAAHRLATSVDDAARAERYRVAIARTLRNAMQLQFADDVDLFYISRPDPVAGGVRTTPYDNEIRVDNVQHILMGLLPVIESFGEADYRIR